MKILLPLLVLTAWFIGGELARAQESFQQVYAEAQRAYLGGNLEVAKQKFLLALELNPKHQPVQNYLRMIRAQEEQAGGANPQQKELQALVLPQVKFREASLDSALEYLKQQAATSAGKTQVNFVSQLPPEMAEKKVTLNLTNVPFTEALRYLGEVGGVTFEIQRYAVLVKPRAGQGPAIQ